MERELEAASLFLEDRSEQLAAYMPVKPLVVIMKDYYCSTLLFENAVYQLSEKYGHRRLAAALGKIKCASGL
jgi:hypothetical protein